MTDLTHMPDEFDTVLAGGHLVDPAQGRDGAYDLGVRGGRIAAVFPRGTPMAARTRIDVSGQLVIPGMIDTHAHVFEHVTGRFGLEADLCGVRSGVTTLIDQGGPSCMTLGAFREYVVKPKRTRVVTYLSSYLVGGMEGHFYPALYRPDCLNVEATLKAALANLDIVKGFKAHAELGGFARWGIAVMRQSAEIARRANLPLYIHFGQLWPLPEGGANGVDADTILAEVVPLLKAGDILAHPFTRHPGGFVNREGKVHAIVREALDMGLKIDVGHGSHFSYQMARIALDAGIVPHTLGADMHGYNTTVPVASTAAADDAPHLFTGQQRFSLASAMTAMLALGLPLAQVVRMVTCNVVDVFGLAPELGTLALGHPADVTVLHDERGRWALRDNEGTQLVGERLLRPAFCLRDGVRIDADASILPTVQAA